MPTIWSFILFFAFPALISPYSQLNNALLDTIQQKSKIETLKNLETSEHCACLFTPIESSEMEEQNLTTAQITPLIAIIRITNHRIVFTLRNKFLSDRLLAFLSLLNNSPPT